MIDPVALEKVSHPAMQAVHEEEVALINALIALIQTRAAPDIITPAIQALIAHMQIHFSEEERMMASCGFSMQSIHKAEHDKVLGEMRYLFMDWRTHKEYERLEEYICEGIPAWLDQHIKAMDIMTADFIMQKM